MQKMGGAQAFPRERITSSVLSLRSNPAKDIVSRFTPSRRCRPDCPGRLRSYIMKMLDDNSDLLKVLRCAFEVYATLKYGYLESVYEAALEYELLQAGFSVSRQVRIPVFYKGVELKKDFYADMVVNDCILLELKAVSSLNQAHEKQLQSYMKSTGIKEGMLLNFGHVRSLQWRAFSP
ncbi:MAG: GxxExxY protein [Methanocorpusculum parvum]|nr:GxxExxY protein [Methanocorpusculum parvum]